METVSFVAGACFVDGMLYMVALISANGRWYVRATWRITLVGLESENPGCPVILDAAAWDRVDGESTDCRLRAAGWDVRPARWIEGKAASPTAMHRGEPGDVLYWSLVDQIPDSSFVEALYLAAWGATHETTPEPRC